jgi:NAD-dependent deacetylase
MLFFVKNKKGEIFMQEEFKGAKFERDGKPRTIVLTGAGISHSAGIPTYEEFPKLRNILTMDFYRKDYFEFWRILAEFQKTIADKQPTMAHKLLANKPDWRIVTMNIDSLHTKAGTKNVVEVHGNLEHVVCTKCGKEYPFDIVDSQLSCEECGGKLRPKVALYGENVKLYNTVMQDINLYSTVIIIGTSFTTNFAEEFKRAAEELEKELIIFNENADSQLLDYLCEQEFS